MMFYLTDAVDVTLESGRRLRIHRDRNIEILDDDGALTPRDNMAATFAFNSTFGIDGKRRGAVA